MLACTAAGVVAGMAGVGALGFSAFEPDDPNRTWLRVGELVGKDERASDLARRLAGSRVEVRGYEFLAGGKDGGFDLYDVPPLPCGGCGLIHMPGVTLRVVGAKRAPAPLRRTALAGRVEIAADGRVRLVADPA